MYSTFGTNSIRTFTGEVNNLYALKNPHSDIIIQKAFSLKHSFKLPIDFSNLIERLCKTSTESPSSFMLEDKLQTQAAQFCYVILCSNFRTEKTIYSNLYALQKSDNI